jgi:hypothetical protein
MKILVTNQVNVDDDSLTIRCSQRWERFDESEVWRVFERFEKK